MLDEPLEAICARQWVAANAHIMEDLQAMNSDRHITVGYDSLVTEPKRVVSDICDFSNITFDKYLRERVASDLPLSRYTQTAPNPEKWKNKQHAIDAVQPLFDATWASVQKFGQ
jgi:hypothetical protein